MNFWIIAVVLLGASAAVVCWPLFAGSTKDRINGILILLITPVAGLLLYNQIGTPRALTMPVTTAQQTAQSQQPHASGPLEMDEMVARLQQRMTENPDDPDGWLILGRSLKTMQRYTEAETALANANRLVPDNPLIMTELAEARLFASGSPVMTPETKQLLEAALAIDPNQQKALWLLGMAYAQEGDKPQAISLWQKLLSQLDPESNPAKAVSRQIDIIQGNAGPGTTPVAAAVTPAPATPVIKQAPAEFGIPVTITVADDLASAVPANATLFIFIHPAGGAGMPLAVKRVAARGFPLSMNFTDADLLRPGTSLKDFEQLDLSARISISGIANAASGDIQANRVTLDTGAVETVALNLDQRVP